MARVQDGSMTHIDKFQVDLIISYIDHMVSQAMSLWSAIDPIWVS